MFFAGLLLFNEGAEVLPVEIYVEAEAGRDVIWDSA